MVGGSAVFGGLVDANPAVSLRPLHCSCCTPLICLTSTHGPLSLQTPNPTSNTTERCTSTISRHLARAGVPTTPDDFSAILVNTGVLSVDILISAAFDQQQTDANKQDAVARWLAEWQYVAGALQSGRLNVVGGEVHLTWAQCPKIVTPGASEVDVSAGGTSKDLAVAVGVAVPMTICLLALVVGIAVGLRRRRQLGRKAGLDAEAAAKGKGGGSGGSGPDAAPKKTEVGCTQCPTGLCKWHLFDFLCQCVWQCCLLTCLLSELDSFLPCIGQAALHSSLRLTVLKLCSFVPQHTSPGLTPLEFHGTLDSSNRAP